MWLTYVIPATLSLPLNVYIFGAFYLGRHKVHKGARVGIKVAAGLALLFVVVDVLPSLFFYTDMTCQGDFFHEVGEGLLCQVSRGSIHILQSMWFWLVASIYDVYLSLVKGAGSKERDAMYKNVRVLCYGIPAVAMFCTYFFQTDKLLTSYGAGLDPEYPNSVWNTYRDMFTCRPLFRTFLLEFLVVYWEFIVGSFVLVYLLYFTVHAMIGFTSKMENLPGAEAVSLANNRYSGTMRNLRKSHSFTLVRLGALSCLLLIANLSVIAVVVPRFENFQQSTVEFTQCRFLMAVDFKGESCMNDLSCCDGIDPFELGLSPDPILLALGYYLTVSALPLLFGMTFVSDKRHLLVWKQGWQALKAKSGQVLSKKSTSVVAVSSRAEQVPLDYVNPSSICDDE
jgi:hypothetical protein